MKHPSKALVDSFLLVYLASAVARESWRSESIGLSPTKKMCPRGFCIWTFRCCVLPFFTFCCDLLFLLFLLISSYGFVPFDMRCSGFTHIPVLVVLSIICWSAIKFAKFPVGVMSEREIWGTLCFWEPWMTTSGQDAWLGKHRFALRNLYGTNQQPLAW